MKEAVECDSVFVQTCYNENESLDKNRFVCSECGYSGVVYYEKISDNKVPRYCPNCAALVEKKMF